MGRAIYEGLMLLRGGLYVEITQAHLDQQRRAAMRMSEYVDSLTASIAAKQREVAELSTKVARAGPKPRTRGVGLDPPKDQDYDDVVYKDDFDAGWRACFVALFGEAEEARQALPLAKKELEKLQKELKSETESRDRLLAEYRRANALAVRRLRRKCRKLESRCSPPP